MQLNHLKQCKESGKSIEPTCKRNMYKSAALQTLSYNSNFLLLAFLDVNIQQYLKDWKLATFSLDSNIFYFQQKKLSKFLSIILFNFI